MSSTRSALLSLLVPLLAAGGACHARGPLYPLVPKQERLYETTITSPGGTSFGTYMTVTHDPVEINGQKWWRFTSTPQNLQGAKMETFYAREAPDGIHESPDPEHGALEWLALPADTAKTPAWELKRQEGDQRYSYAGLQTIHVHDKTYRDCVTIASTLAGADGQPRVRQTDIYCHGVGLTRRIIDAYGTMTEMSLISLE